MAGALRILLKESRKARKQSVQPGLLVLDDLTADAKVMGSVDVRSTKSVQHVHETFVEETNASIVVESKVIKNKFKTTANAGCQLVEDAPKVSEGVVEAIGEKIARMEEDLSALRETARGGMVAGTVSPEIGEDLEHTKQCLLRAIYQSAETVLRACDERFCKIEETLAIWSVAAAAPVEEHTQEHAAPTMHRTTTGQTSEVAVVLPVSISGWKEDNERTWNAAKCVCRNWHALLSEGFPLSLNEFLYIDDDLSENGSS